MPSLFQLALAYTKAGISIIPILPDKATAPNGSKKTLFDCRQYIRHRIAAPETLRKWFVEDAPFGLAAVLGSVSAGLECLDLTYGAVVKLFQQLVSLQGGESLLEKLPTARSAVAGRTRIYYRCANPTRGYKRLAQFELPNEPGTVRLQVLAFVQGEGSWTELPSSTTLGTSDDAFEWVSLDLTQVPVITEDERLLLLESASCLNACVDPSAILAPASPDGFDHSVTWEQILARAGWRKVRDFGDMAVWHTPERTMPGYCAVSGIGLNHDLLYIIQTGRAYTKFGAFASFHFDGDFDKARSVGLQPSTRSRWETAAGTRYLRAVKTKPLPLVSCITPTTGDRRCFLPQAIRCFQRQTYPNLELVILCDGEDDMSDLIPGDDKRVRYFYLGRDRQTVGAKLNLGCERASGDLMAHFDDDDWSHPDRLSFQVGALLAEGAEFCGLPLMLFYVIASGEVWLSRTPALLHPSLWNVLPAGASFLYRREFWSRSPFPDIRLGQDMAFIEAQGRQDRAILVSDYWLYVAMIHTCNTDDYGRFLSSSYCAPWRGDIREVMGADIDFYLSMLKN